MRISDWSSDVCSSDLGALIKDRLFFYGLFNFRKADFTNFSNDLKDDVTDNDPFWGFNIDGVLLESDTWGRHSFTWTHIDDSHSTKDLQSNFDRDTVSVGSTRGLITPNLGGNRSAEHTSELQSLMRLSYAVFCLKKTTRPTIL